MPAGFPRSCPALPMAQRTPAVDSGTLASGAELLMQFQQQFGGRPVGAVDDEAPTQPVGLQSDFGAVAFDARRVVLAPGLGTAGRDGAGALRLDEFDAPRIREGFLGW